jgi:uncharacterized protein (DUF1501 family)
MVNVLAAPTDYRALVCVFLNGGNDSHNTVVPLEASGPFSYRGILPPAGWRSRAPTAGAGALLPIQVPAFGNATLGLHASLGPATAGAPATSSLHGLWGLGKVAVVANVGPLVEPLTQAQYKTSGKKPYQLFSHSDQVAQWQTSISTTRAQTGWGGRWPPGVPNGGSGFCLDSVAHPALRLGAATPTGHGHQPPQPYRLSGFNNSASHGRRNSMTTANPRPHLLLWRTARTRRSRP